MAEYRDIGYLSNDESTGAQVPVDLLNRGQVYYATHKNNALLSRLERSFISFSWGEKNIEDFGFLVISNGDRYQRPMYAQFQENVTNSEVFDGQKYWGYHFNANNISFGLATDGVLESTLQEFRDWFKPGIARDLILSEYPNRAISARVVDVPIYSLLPFEEKITKKIGNQEYTTSTTLWRGEISLNFVMDDPFWKNKESYFEGNLTKEEFKIIEEDGIPHAAMFDDFFCFLADNKSYTVEDGIIDNDGIGITSSDVLYLYNCGTGIAKPTLKFNFALNYDTVDNLDTYINFPKNSYTEVNANNAYSTITVGDKIFKFTTPSILTSYNQVIKIISDYSPGDSIIDLKSEFQEGINDIYIRAWAVGLTEMMIAADGNINICDSNGALTENFKENFINVFKTMFSNDQTFDCSIDSETGAAEIQFDLNLMNPYIDVNDELQLDLYPVTIKENIGDMICSKYLIIDKKTSPSLDSENNLIITEEDCLEVTADCSLNNLQIIYNYMYL